MTAASLFRPTYDDQVEISWQVERQTSRSTGSARGDAFPRNQRDGIAHTPQHADKIRLQNGVAREVAMNIDVEQLVHWRGATYDIG